MTPATALEHGFPIVEISKIAEHESWRKEINRPIYHIHKWWAIRLGSVFRAMTLAALRGPATDTWQDFYERHRLNDKVVLDPFMGSGTTLGEAVKLGAKAIGCDVNPVSSFLVRQAFARVSEAQLRAAFARLESKVAAEIRHYYQTRDPASGKLIPVLYFFWVKTVVTPLVRRCLSFPDMSSPKTHTRRRSQERSSCAQAVGACSKIDTTPPM